MRVVVGEDQALFRQGMVGLLSGEGFEVVAEAADADELVRKVAAHRPDVIVTDVRMPPTNTDDCLRAALAIRERFGIAVLVLSQYVAERSALDLIAEDADGVGLGFGAVLELRAPARSFEALASTSTAVVIGRA